MTKEELEKLIKFQNNIKEKKKHLGQLQEYYLNKNGSPEDSHLRIQLNTNSNFREPLNHNYFPIDFKKFMEMYMMALNNDIISSEKAFDLMQIPNIPE